MANRTACSWSLYTVASPPTHRNLKTCAMLYGSCEAITTLLFFQVPFEFFLKRAKLYIIINKQLCHLQLDIENKRLSFFVCECARRSHFCWADCISKTTDRHQFYRQFPLFERRLEGLRKKLILRHSCFVGHSAAKHTTVRKCLRICQCLGVHLPIIQCSLT